MALNKNMQKQLATRTDRRVPARLTSKKSIQTQQVDEIEKESHYSRESAIKKIQENQKSRKSMLQVRLAKRNSNSRKNLVERASSVSNVVVQPTSVESAVSNIAGDVQVEVIRKCIRAVISTPKRLKQVMRKLNTENTTGLCKNQFVQMIMLCVKKKNKENGVDGQINVKLTTIDAMWVLIQPMQVNDREGISAQVLGAWLFSKD